MAEQAPYTRRVAGSIPVPPTDQYFPYYIIEHQLAHAVRDPNGRAYNRTAFLPKRRKMMQQWADYLDKLKADVKVLPFKQAEEA